MNDFLIYAARMQDAGVSMLDVSLSIAKDGTRLMAVSIGSDEKRAYSLSMKYPTRIFELCGSDPLLEKLKDDMTYSEDGPQAWKVDAAIAEYPYLAEDLRDWFDDWNASRGDVLDDEAPLSEGDVTAAELSVARIQGLMRGLDIARERAAKAGK